MCDVDGAGRPNSLFDGTVDEGRISSTARYKQRSWRPLRRFEADEDTKLLLHLDELFGIWLLDDSGQAAHGERRGEPQSVRIRR